MKFKSCARHRLGILECRPGGRLKDWKDKKMKK